MKTASVASNLARRHLERQESKHLLIQASPVSSWFPDVPKRPSKLFPKTFDMPLHQSTRSTGRCRIHIWSDLESHEPFSFVERYIINDIALIVSLYPCRLPRYCNQFTSRVLLVLAAHFAQFTSMVHKAMITDKSDSSSLVHALPRKSVHDWASKLRCVVKRLDRSSETVGKSGNGTYRLGSLHAGQRTGGANNPSFRSTVEAASSLPFVLRL